MVEYLKSINRIPIEQIEKILCISIKYIEVTRRGSTLAQIWQKLQCIKSLIKEQF